MLLVTMRLLKGLDGLRQVPPGSVLTVGNFDGVHLGHTRLLERCRELAGDRSPVVAVTFEPHPLSRLNPELAPPRLTPLELKYNLLESACVDILVELAPEPDVLTTTARDFFELLVNALGVHHLVEGPDFSFGKSREGNIEALGQWSIGTSMRVHVINRVSVPLTSMHIVEVRSSLIRWLVAYGRMRDAAVCLGRPYILRGKIVEGFKRGRLLGMPTANFNCGQQMMPPDGVYAGRCKIEGQSFPAAASIGTLPTFGEHPRQIEAHLIGFTGDLYGKTLDLELLDYLRDQVRFKDVGQLKEKMRQDIVRCQELAGYDFSQPVLQV